MRGDGSWVLSLASILAKKYARDRVASVSGADYEVSPAYFFVGVLSMHSPGSAT